MRPPWVRLRQPGKRKKYILCRTSLNFMLSCSIVATSTTSAGRPLRILEFGETEVPKDMLEDYLHGLHDRFNASVWMLFFFGGLTLFSTSTAFVIPIFVFFIAYSPPEIPSLAEQLQPFYARAFDFPDRQLSSRHCYQSAHRFCSHVSVRMICCGGLFMDRRSTLVLFSWCPACRPLGAMLAPMIDSMFARLAGDGAPV